MKQTPGGKLPKVCNVTVEFCRKEKAILLPQYLIPCWAEIRLLAQDVQSKLRASVCEVLVETNTVNDHFARSSDCRTTAYTVRVASKAWSYFCTQSIGRLLPRVSKSARTPQFANDLRIPYIFYALNDPAVSLHHPYIPLILHVRHVGLHWWWYWRISIRRSCS